MFKKEKICSAVLSFDGTMIQGIMNNKENEKEILRENSVDESLRISFSSNESSQNDINRLEMANNRINVACTNARSLVDKIDSLITLFEESSLHIALITETWLSPKHCPPRKMADLTVGSDLNLIRRDRGSRGGGGMYSL